MSYAVSAALQTSLYQALCADAALVALVGTAIFDAPPQGTPPALWVALGPETVKDSSDKSGAGALHELEISVVASADGFHALKTVAGAVSDALAGEIPALGRGNLIYLNFLKARARREGRLRRIDLTFRARVQDS
ncbi:DUF3168 domain-containing protein [Pseudooceanicola sp. CBS1P-1]|uniref:DUF3168 domain-containing protein n=1 Tax=Pseudooceanicola albus TaxID=2692189 RepID=A0A6L7G9Y2_9RHOB|nr:MULTISPECIES: DUF3168 domain-containing protein [Pseudooceanicola]MBT9384253.1 DUF3168 domain-containing protein [Pseudooceanicola endophyticus]MXN20845.1 DUF3168 domain-containing protein [Pseudooceanicola albus]